LITNLFKLIFEFVIEKQLNKTTKLINILIELLRTLLKKIESNNAYIKMLKLNVKQILNIIKTLIKQLATIETNKRDVEI